MRGTIAKQRGNGGKSRRAPREFGTMYEQRYDAEGFYWGKAPSGFARTVLEFMPVDGKSPTLLDVGCGEGRNAVFFARNGYDVTAFDLSSNGVRKTRELAKEAGVSVEVYEGDIRKHRLKSRYDIIFAHGVLHYIPPGSRAEIMEDFKRHTNPGGVNMLSVFVKKPFIPPAPDGEKSAYHWKSGELFAHYHDWLLERCAEEIFDCNSSGVAHRHAINKLIARKVV